MSLATLTEGGIKMATKKNYSKISTEKVKSEQSGAAKVKTTLDPVEPKVTEEVAPVTPKVKKGIVTGCAKLNVRNNPHPNAAIERTIDQRTEVEIIDSQGDFYHVRKGTVTDGFTGWCMKKFITVLKK